MREFGTVLGRHGVGSNPYAIALDASNGYTYVANQGSDNVSVLNGTVPVTNVTVGLEPEGIVFNPYNDLVDVSNREGDSVTVINGTTGLRTLSSSGEFDGPYEMAVDPRTGDVFVPNVDASSGYLTVVDPSFGYSTVPTGTYPAGAAYDPANGWVYVSNAAAASNGGGSVTVINGSSVVTTITGGFTTPIGIAYDPADGNLYVADEYYASPSQGAITVVNGPSVLGSVSTGGSTWDAVYDPASGKIVTANEESNNLSVVAGLSVVATLHLPGNGSGPYNLAVDPITGALLVPLSGSDTLVDLLGSDLAEGPLNLSINGTREPSSEIGIPFQLATALEGGLTPDSFALGIAPSAGISCGSPADVNARLETVGVASEAETVTVWLHTTEAMANAVDAWLEVRVAPTVGTPTVAEFIAEEAFGVDADANESVTLNATATGGSGVYAFEWTTAGPVRSVCGRSGASVRCDFPQPGAYRVAVRAIDSYGGMNATSVVVNVTLALLAGPITPSAEYLDAGQSVSFTIDPTGGTGIIRSYDWGGVPAGNCSGLTTAAPQCRVSAGTYNVTVAVTDSRLATAEANRSVVVAPGLEAGVPTVSRASVDLGQSLVLNGSSYGGRGLVDLSWSELPAPCQNLTSGELECAPATPGTYGVSPTATDAAGARSVSANRTILVYADPSVSAPTETPSPATFGDPVTIEATVGPGRAPDTFVWTGLPSGCRSENGSSLTCTPTLVEDAAVSVTVTDSNGVVATSPVAILSVYAAPQPVVPIENVTNATNLTVSAAPGWEVYAIAGIGIVLGAAAMALRLRSGRRPPDPPMNPEPEPYAPPDVDYSDPPTDTEWIEGNA